MQVLAALTAALVPILDREPVTFTIPVEGGEPLAGTFHPAPPLPEPPLHDLATLVVVPDAGDIHIRLESLVPPAHLRLMNLVVLDATRQDLAPLLAWLSARGLDTTRLGLVGLGEGATSVVATRAAHPDAVRAAALISPPASVLEASDWAETPLFLYEAGPARSALAEVVKTLQPMGRLGVRLPRQGPRGCDFLDGHGNRSLVTSWMRDLLVHTAYLAVPAYPAGDERVDRPGFVNETRRVGRERGETGFELMTWSVGEVWTVGAMVHGSFTGTVTFEVEGHELEVALDTAAVPEGTLSVLRNGAPCDLVGHRASFRGWTWVNLELARPLENARLALTYRPSEGEPLRLPGVGSNFGVHLVER